MTVVAADSSPLNYLTLIGSVKVSHGLYRTIVVPYQVINRDAFCASAISPSARA